MHGPVWIPSLIMSSVPAASFWIANAQRTAASAFRKTAMTASPMVFTIAPWWARIRSVMNSKCFRTSA